MFMFIIKLFYLNFSKWYSAGSLQDTDLSVFSGDNQLIRCREVNTHIYNAKLIYFYNLQ